MSELRVIAKHAGTVLVGQLAVMAYGITDTIVAGRYSEKALAALSVGSAVYVTVFVAFIGIFQALLPAWAELHGARRGGDLGRSVRQALYLAAISSAAGIACLLVPGPLLAWTEVPPPLQPAVRGYLNVLTLALPLALLFRMFSTLNQSLGRPKVITWLQVLSLFVKIPLSIWFAFGGLGLPAQGVEGCAWATVVVYWVLVAVALWLLRTQPMYEQYAIWRRMEPPHWRTIADFARLGVPSGLSVLVEVSSFTFMAIFIARQGTTAAAAHQIAANVAAVLFMVPLSLAVATSARVSYWLGARDPARARAVIVTGMKVAAVLAVTASALMAALHDVLPRIYTAERDVIAVASVLLFWLAVFHVGDAAQGMCVFILRCYRVTIAPLVAYCLLLWGVGLGGGFMLAYRGIGPFPAMQSPAAFWIAAAVALVVVGLILPAILWRAARAYRPA